MPETYLTTAYKNRAQVKALGARRDSDQKQWYVPDGLDLTPFQAWLTPSSMPVAIAAPARRCLSALHTSRSGPAPATWHRATKRVVRI